MNLTIAKQALRPAPALCPELCRPKLALFFIRQNSLIPSSQLTVNETKQAGNMKKISISTFLRNVEGICFPLCKNVTLF